MKGTIYKNRGTINENEGTINNIGGTIYESNDSWILAVMAPHKKELLTTQECLNYKKSSQQLPSCLICNKDVLFCKCFRHYSALSKKRHEKLFEETAYK